MNLSEKIDNFSLTFSARNELNEIIDKLPKAKNIIEFVTSPKFLGFKTIFPLQYKILLGFFELCCPYCNKIDTENFLNIEDNILSSLILFENGVCPKCERTKYEFFKENKIKFYNDLVGVAGTKSGKTTLVGAMIAPYVFYRLIVDRDFREWLHILPWIDILMVFVATSREQVKRTGWDFFINTINNSPWFVKFFDSLQRFCKRNKISIDELYSFNMSSSIRLRFLNLEVVCLHSNAFSIAGGTFIFSMIDEIARFDHTDSKRSADEIYRVCRNNLIPIRESIAHHLENGNVYKNGDFIDAYLAVISAPISEDDKIMRLLKEAAKNQRRFYFHKSTFDMNPMINKDHLIPDMEEDPDKFMRDFEAEPTEIGVPFIGSVEIIKRAVKLVEPVVTWQIERKSSGMVFGRENLRLCLKLIDAKRDRLSSYFIHADPGRLNDSFGIVIGKMEGDQKDYKIIITDVIEIAIPKVLVNKKTFFYEIDFESVKNFFVDLSKLIFIRAISFDRWNSISHVQALRDIGLDVSEISLRYEDYLAFRQDFYAQRIFFPLPKRDNWENVNIRELDPNSKILKELYLLRDFGKNIDHPIYASNDLIVCAVGIYRLVIEKMMGISKDGDKKNVVFNPAIRYNIMKGKTIHLRKFV